MGGSPRSTRRPQSHRMQPIIARGWQEQNAKDAMDAKGAKDNSVSILSQAAEIYVNCRGTRGGTEHP